MIRSLRNVSCFFLSATLFLALSSVAVGVPSSYQGDFDLGFDTGYPIGYDTGLAEGQARGDEEGTANGHAEGYSGGWDDFYGPAYDAAFEISFPVGYEEGFQCGMPEGFDKGYNRAIDKIIEYALLEQREWGILLEAGVLTAAPWNHGGAFLGHILTRSGSYHGSDGSFGDVTVYFGFEHHDEAYYHKLYFDEGYADGKTSGFEIGSEEGYELAYPIAFAAAYDVGYGEGVEEGTLEGTLVGDEAGLAEGWDSGNDVGYDEGYDDGYLYVLARVPEEVVSKVFGTEGLAIIKGDYLVAVDFGLGPVPEPSSLAMLTMVLLMGVLRRPAGRL